MKRSNYVQGRMLVITLALMLVFTSISFAAPNENAATAFDKKVLTRIDAERALEHIRYLSEEIGPRVATTEEEREAAEYIKSKFEEYGYDPMIQEFSYETTQSQVIINSLDNKELKSYGAEGNNFTGYTSFTGNLVDCGLGLTADEFPSEVEGQIALIRRGSTSDIIGYFSLKAANAVEAGAKAILLYSDERAPVSPWLGDAVVDIPVAMVSNADGVELLEEMNNLEEGQYIQATVKVERVSVQSQNVIAAREPENKENKGIVYVTAHYDSVSGAPGANDNASGTAMMLEFARILKAYPIDKEVRFIACGAEEVGLEGSYYYARQLTDEEIERSIANFNMDMIATSAEECNVLYADTVDGEENIVTEYSTAAGARIGVNVLETAKGSSSDHASFAYFGIPAACFIWGDEEGYLEKWYHTPNDTISMNISLEKLQTAGEIIGSALYDVLRAATPNLEKSSVIKYNDEKIVFKNRKE